MSAVRSATPRRATLERSLAFIFLCGRKAVNAIAVAVPSISG